MTQLTIFGWLAIVGPGFFSLDYLLQRASGSKFGDGPMALAPIQS